MSSIIFNALTTLKEKPSDFSLELAANLSVQYTIATSYVIDNSNTLQLICNQALNGSSVSQLCSHIIVKNYLLSKKNTNNLN